MKILLLGLLISYACGMGIVYNPPQLKRMHFDPYRLNVLPFSFMPAMREMKCIHPREACDDPFPPSSHLVCPLHAPKFFACDYYDCPVTCTVQDGEAHCISECTHENPFGYAAIGCRVDGEIEAGSCMLFYLLSDEYAQVTDGTRWKFLAPEPEPEKPKSKGWFF